MTAYPKRLIEVDLPIKRISEPASQEKRVGARAHVWWSWKPLSACRAEVLAAALPDPCDSNCPAEFRQAAAFILAELRDAIGGRPRKLDDMAELRAGLLDLVALLATINPTTTSAPLAAAQRLVLAARQSGTLGERTGNAILADPFAGSGSIPLEGVRLGLDVFVSDLNPVAVFLEEVVLRQAPILGNALSDTLRRWGEWIARTVQERVRHLYPSHSEGNPIAYLWLHTARCTGPGCGAEVPLASKLWLAKKGQRYALRLVPDSSSRKIDVEIIRPKSEADVGAPTVRLGSMTCPIPTCGFTTKKDKVRAQIAEAAGGVANARLASVVVTRSAERGRHFVSPSEADLLAMRRATAEVQDLSAVRAEVSAIPNEPIPNERVWKNNPIRVHLYGMRTWGDLFNPRQALAMVAFVDAVRKLPEVMRREGVDEATANATAACLSLAVDRMADHLNTLCRWNPSGPKLQNLFSQQAIPFVWDFAEAHPFGDSVGDWSHAVECVIEGLLPAAAARGRATVQAANAACHPLPDDSVDLIVTDPPYYDQVPYATVSEFFYVWLKRSVAGPFAPLFQAQTTPKDEECVIDEVRHKDKAFFERTMRTSLEEARRIARPDAIAIVIFAHKTTSGWEALLQAVIDAGWIVTASWPLNTELGTRMRAQESAALASSIHLVCRPRENEDGSVRAAVGDWRDVLQELPNRIHEWMPRLAEESVVGADAIFACLGPALEIFSRYSRVEKASGEVVALREYMEQVWAAVAKEALTMVFHGADASGFDPDARLTAMWLWTLSAGNNGSANGQRLKEDQESEDDESAARGKKTAQGGFVLEYDAARKIAQGLGANLEELASLVEVKGDKARLLPVAERTKSLFGKDESGPATKKGKKKAKQQMAFGFRAELEAVEEEQGWGVTGAPQAGQTVLDRIHQSMILFAAGRGEAMKRFLVEEGAGRDERFWRLAQALSALYPPSTDEKRWVDGVLARKKGLGL